MQEHAHERTPADLWEKLKPLAREMRQKPTFAENQLWQQLRAHRLKGAHFRRQHPIDRFIVDFYSHHWQLVVEVDGKVHQYTQAEDALRQAFLESLGLSVLRFQNQQVVKHMEDVLHQIVAAGQTQQSSTPP